MGLIQVPIQPRKYGTIDINWSNPLAKNIAFVCVPGYYEDIVNRTHLSGGRVYTKTGLGAATDGTLSGYLQAPAPVNSSSLTAELYDVAGPITVYALLRQITEANSAYGFVRSHGSVDPAWGVGLHGGSYDGPYGNLGSFAFSPSAADPYMVGILQSVAVSGDGSNAISYYRGRRYSSGAYTPPTYEYNAGNYRAVLIGSNGLGAAIGGIQCFFAALWRRALSDAEHLSLALDPWQILSTRRVLIPIASVGGAPTLSDLKAVSVTSSSVQATYDYAF